MSHQCCHFICYLKEYYLVGNTDDVLAVEALQDGARLVPHADHLHVLRVGLAEAVADHFRHARVHGAAQTCGRITLNRG